MIPVSAPTTASEVRELASAVAKKARDRDLAARTNPVRYVIPIRPIDRPASVPVPVQRHNEAGSIRQRELIARAERLLPQCVYPARRYILCKVAIAFDLPVRDILSTSRVAKLHPPRRALAYLLRELRGDSLPTIGKFMNRDHTTVLHALRCCERSMTADAAVRMTMQTLRDGIVSEWREASSDEPVSL